MKHSAGIGTFDRIAAAIIVIAAGACGFAAIAGVGTFTPSLAGAVQMEAADARVQVVRDGVALRGLPQTFQLGDSLTVLSGRPVIKVPGGSVQLDPGAVVDIQDPIQIDRASALVRGSGVRLAFRGVTAVIDGVAQIERGYSTQIAVLSGSATVESLGRVLPLASLSQVTLPGAGLLPFASEPLDASSVRAAGLNAPPDLSASVGATPIVEPAPTAPRGAAATSSGSSPVAVATPTHAPEGGAQRGENVVRGGGGLLGGLLGS